MRGGIYMTQRSIGDRLDSLPLTRVHIRTLVIVGLGLFFDLFDVFLAGVLGTVLTSSFGFSGAQLPLVLGSSFLGMFFGATCMGFVADRFGRRRAYLINLAIYSVFTLAGAFSPDATFLIITRCLAGVGIGAQLPLSDSYLSEILPARQRGVLISWAYTVGFIGNPVLGLLARLLVPTHYWNVDGWRWLFVIGGLGGLTIWIAQRVLPESPRWLASVGRLRDAEQITDYIADLPGASAKLMSSSASLRTDGLAQLRAALHLLFSDAYRKRTLMFCAFQVFQTAGYYGFGTMVPLVLAAKGFSVLTSLTYTTIAFIGYPVGSALSVLVIERIDRRWLIIGTSTLMGVLGLALGNATNPLAIGIIGISYTLISNVFSNAFHTFQGEIFPTSVRATAASSAYGISRLSTAAMPFVLLPVLKDHGPTAMFAVVSAAMLIMILIIAFFAPATTGRPLEDIAA